MYACIFLIQINKVGTFSNTTYLAYTIETYVYRIELDVFLSFLKTIIGLDTTIIVYNSIYFHFEFILCISVLGFLVYKIENLELTESFYVPFDIGLVSKDINYIVFSVSF